MNKYFLKGDISGIQEFIFNVQTKGAAKSLKAKSYLIQVIGNLAAQYCLDCLSEFNSTLFYEGGGSFFIEFEVEEEKADEIIAKVQEDLNKELCRDDFSIVLSYVPVVNERLGEAWIQLREESNKKKLVQYQNYYEFFEPYSKNETDRETNQERHPENIVEKLTGLEESNMLFKTITNEMVKNTRFCYQLFKREIKKEEKDFELTLINKLPFWKDYSQFETYRNYREKYFPSKDEEKISKEGIIDFDALGDFAESRTGTNKIGILKLDVDNLGKHFGQSKDHNGLKNLSKELKDFFVKKLYEIFQGSFSLFGDEEQYNTNIYPIFAGGDDCFIIGAWDALLCFASDLQEAFMKNFSKKNLSISAGIIIVNPTHPVISFSEQVENALSKAKNKEGKNAVCFFDLTFTWDEYRYILSTSKELRKAMEEKDIDRSYLDKIRKSARGFNALQNTDGIDFNKIYKLKYYLSKNEEKLEKVRELLFDPYYKSLLDRVDQKETALNLAIYPAIARLTELLTKETNKKQLEYGSRYL